MKFILVHGSFGHPEENWFPWLREHLESQSHAVFAPAFPRPPEQDLASWMMLFKDSYMSLADDEAILIGHSLGPAFILTVLERLRPRRPVKACVFASGFIELLDNPTFDTVNRTFVDKQFDWERIKANCEQFIVLHGENDPYVPLTAAQHLADQLGVDVKIVPNGGHLNTAAGFTEFPQLLEEIDKLLTR